MCGSVQTTGRKLLGYAAVVMRALFQLLFGQSEFLHFQLYSCIRLTFFVACACLSVLIEPNQTVRRLRF